MLRIHRISPHLIALLVFAASFCNGLQAEESDLVVCTTLPDLGDLARAVGGDDVQVSVLVKGPQTLTASCRAPTSFALSTVRMSLSRPDSS